MTAPTPAAAAPGRSKLVLWSSVIPSKGMAEGLSSVDGIDLVVASSEAEAIAELQAADALVTLGLEATYTPALAQAVHSQPRLRWLQLASTGQDGLDRHGVPAGLLVSGLGAAYAPAVAEHAMGLLMALCRRLPEATLQQQRGEWNRALTTRMSSLEGRTLGIVGFGRIGQEIARRAHAFGMDCVAVNTSGQLADTQLASRAWPLQALNEALGQCDAVAIALPLTERTRNAFGAAQWTACRRGALVVNVGRGGLVDTDSLVAALQDGRLGGAGLDVTEPEPLPAGHPLWSAPNTLITPHVAGGGSPPSQRRAVEVLCTNARRFLAGEPLDNLLTVARLRQACA